MICADREIGRVDLRRNRSSRSVCKGGAGTIGAKAFLIDLDGVLYVDKTPVEGAKETVAMLEEMGYRYRFVSNTTSKSRRSLAKFLGDMGFEISIDRIFTPGVAAAGRIGSEGDKRCFLITTPDLRAEFQEAGISIAGEDADYVVVGDAEDGFTYDRLKRAFRLVMEGARIIALEKDRYWMGADGLCLSAGRPLRRSPGVRHRRRRRCGGKALPQLLRDRPRRDGRVGERDGYDRRRHKHRRRRR
jgi:hypothetical protein